MNLTCILRDVGESEGHFTWSLGTCTKATRHSTLAAMKNKTSAELGHSVHTAPPKYKEEW